MRYTYCTYYMRTHAGLHAYAPMPKASTKKRPHAESFYQKTCRLENILSRLKTYPFNTSPVLSIKKYSKRSQQEIFAFVFILSQGSEREKNKLVVKYNISFFSFCKRESAKPYLWNKNPEYLSAILSKRLCCSVLIGSNVSLWTGGWMTT